MATKKQPRRTAVRRIVVKRGVRKSPRTTSRKKGRR